MESNHRCLPLGCLIYSQVGSPLPNTSVEGQVGIAPTSNWVTASPLSIWVLPHCGSRGRLRTFDPRVINTMLYQLSYATLVAGMGIAPILKGL